MQRPSGIVLVAILFTVVVATAVWFTRDRRMAASAVDETPPAPAPAPVVVAAEPPGTPLLARPRRASPGVTATPTTEDSDLLDEIRALVRSEPSRAEALAREARSRFPDSPHADAWDALLVEALVNQQRMGAARSETYYYYDHHPRGAYTPHLFALTGVHPTPVAPGPQ